MQVIMIRWTSRIVSVVLLSTSSLVVVENGKSKKEETNAQFEW